ncbi:two-component system response regulator BtsR [Shewanella marina]|uniref:two-component system response regulator BtsR n=1 Tax=Shewanella marina TaxID=487319 RepID=UPI000471D4B7|nr:two-component system response regulator BtsR [Shewanella marina]
MIRTIVVDDELYAREALIELLQPFSQIEIIAQCANAIEAMQKINQLKPDLVFLDIHMPKISGMELLAMQDPENMPYFVFVTAYDEFAINAFEHHAFDYLLKPVEPQRLHKTIDKLQLVNHKQTITAIAPEQLQHIPCFNGSRLKVVKTDEIEFVMSDVGGVHVYNQNGMSHTQLTLKVLEQKTPLIRCHRQYLITPAAIREIELLDTGAQITTTSGQHVPVSRRYLKELKSLFGF